MPVLPPLYLPDLLVGAERVSLTPHRVDVVLPRNGLDYVDDQEHVLRAAHRLVSPHGDEPLNRSRPRPSAAARKDGSPLAQLDQPSRQEARL